MLDRSNRKLSKYLEFLAHEDLNNAHKNAQKSPSTLPVSFVIGKGDDFGLV